jgi:hypothetical protein
MRVRRWVPTVLVLLAAIVSAVVWLMSVAYVPYGYTVESEFSSVPADDARLAGWLRAQPGVIEDHVRINRYPAATTTAVVVHFVQSRNMLGTPSFPAMDSACRDLGYGPPVQPFHDSDPQRSRR